MKDAVEIKGLLIELPSKAREFYLVPTGNHRNHQRVQVEPLGIGAKGGHRCPRCKAPMRAWVQTYPTPVYETWKEAAIQSLRAKYPPGTFDAPVIVCLWLFGGRGFIESRDWDNVQKCVGDALAESLVLPVPKGLPALKDDKERTGGDDVRSIKGWRTHYLTKAEHVAVMGGASSKAQADKTQARLFVQLVDSRGLDPFKL